MTELEGGTRLNYGVQYTADFANGGHANVVAGESIQVAGQNSYTLYDVAHTGMYSGLDKTFSNFVAGEMIQPTSAPISLLSKQQFDSTTFQLDRFDAIAKATLGGLSGSVDYALYAAQPALGWQYPREGLVSNASYKFQDRWTIDGSLVLDMSRHFYDVPGQETPVFYPIGYSLGLVYKDACTTLTVRYSSSTSAPAAFTNYAGGPLIYLPATRNQTLFFELVLRTLGDIKGNVGLGASGI